MTQVYIFAGVGVTLLIGGIIIGKIGTNRCKTGLIVLGFFMGLVGAITGWFGYESFMTMPMEYSITSCRQNGDSYSVTLEGNMRGFTNGTITISKSEAQALNLVTVDENGEMKWVGGTIKESRSWVSDHRDN